MIDACISTIDDFHMQFDIKIIIISILHVQFMQSQCTSIYLWTQFWTPYHLHTSEIIRIPNFAAQ